MNQWNTLFFKTVYSVGPGTTLPTNLKESDVGDIPVVVAGEAVGMLTDRDITIRIAAHGLDPQKTHVSDAMTEEVVACKEDDDVGIAARLKAENQIRRLIVVEDGANCPAWCLWEILRNTLMRNRTGL